MDVANARREARLDIVAWLAARGYDEAATAVRDVYPLPQALLAGAAVTPSGPGPAPELAPAPLASAEAVDDAEAPEDDQIGRAHV